MPPIQLDFRSQLTAGPKEVWTWITSADGILREMRPLFRMTMPRGVKRLEDLEIVPGKRLFRSRLYLFGFLPFGYSDLTLLEWSDGVGFVEQSPMTGMKLWRHERTIHPTADGCTLTDKLTFEPRFAKSLVAWFTRRMFEHRHAVLRRNLGS